MYGAPSSENLPERAQRLFDGLFRKHHDVYRLAGVEARLDDVVQWLPGFDRRTPAAHGVHLRFARDYAGNLGRFRSALPDFDDRASPVTLLPSLMHFDAHLQPNGSTTGVFLTLKAAGPKSSDHVAEPTYIDGPQIRTPEMASGALVTLHLAGEVPIYFEISSYANDYPIDRHPNDFALVELPRANLIDLR